MKEEMEKNRSVCFYLATDDESERSNLEKRYPIIKRSKYEKGVSRITNAGMMDAVVAMLCLSRCDKIYGSYGSTFSKWAARIGNTSLEYVVREE